MVDFETFTREDTHRYVPKQYRFPVPKGDEWGLVPAGGIAVTGEVIIHPTKQHGKGEIRICSAVPYSQEKVYDILKSQLYDRTSGIIDVRVVNLVAIGPDATCNMYEFLEKFFRDIAKAEGIGLEAKTGGVLKSHPCSIAESMSGL